MTRAVMMSPSLVTPAAVQRFVDAVVEDRPSEARRILRDTVAHVGPIGAIERLLAPAQIRIGAQWLAAAVSSADEHRVSAAVDAALDELERSSEIIPTGPALGVSTGGSDWHATAARMAVHRLRAVGWDARFIGVPLSEARLAEARERTTIDAVALSCVAAPHLLGVARAIRIAHAADLSVMVGGQAFVAHPLRARRLGADAGPGLERPPATRQGSWLDPSTREQLPSSVDARVDAVLELDLGIVTQQLQDALRDAPIAVDDRLAAALLRPNVDAWASAVAVDEPGIVTEQLNWTASYLAARGEPLDHVRVLAAGLRAVVPVDPGEVLRTAAGQRR